MTKPAAWPPRFTSAPSTAGRTYLGKDPADLKFKVTWIGFWFNIPGVTSTRPRSPMISSTAVTTSSFPVSTPPKVLSKPRKLSEAGKPFGRSPMTIKGACEEAQKSAWACPTSTGVPLTCSYIKAAKDGTLEASLGMDGPDWTDINNPDTSAVGFMKGAALSADAAAKLDEFIAELAGGLEPWTGPINLQDGTELPGGWRSRHRSRSLVPAPAAGRHGRPERSSVTSRSFHQSAERCDMRPGQAAHITNSDNLLMDVELIGYSQTFR